ncbi:MAG: anti-sigma factor family protein [Geminicoccaceae bacterium]
MSEPAQHISEIELHGYLDGELSEERAILVEAYLDEDDEASAKLFHYGIQGDLIRRLYGPLLNRPVPHPIAAKLATLKVAGKRRNGMANRLKLGVAAVLLAGTALAAFAWYFELIEVSSWL